MTMTGLLRFLHPWTILLCQLATCMLFTMESLHFKITHRVGKLLAWYDTTYTPEACCCEYMRIYTCNPHCMILRKHFNCISVWSPEGITCDQTAGTTLLYKCLSNMMLHRMFNKGVCRLLQDVRQEWVCYLLHRMSNKSVHVASCTGSSTRVCMLPPAQDVQQECVCYLLHRQLSTQVSSGNHSAICCIQNVTQVTHAVC